MLQGWIDSILAAPDSPTSDLYFANAARAAGWPLARVAPTVFKGVRATLVLRHAARAGRLSGPVVYAVDDDVEAGLTDPSLPRFYRRKLALLEAPSQRRMRREADLIVVASETLEERLRSLSGPPLRRVLPYWSEALPALDHHQSDGPLNVVYLGSSVHRADLRFLLPVVEAVLDAEPRAVFHLAERHLLPASLARNPRIARLPGRGWGAYRRSMTGRRFHVALYPLLDTPFNRARSPNKLIEHAVRGAAPVYSACWPEAARVADGSHGLIRANRPGDWIDATLDLLRNAAGRSRIAAGARRLAARLNDPAAQQALWSRAIGATA